VSSAAFAVQKQSVAEYNIAMRATEAVIPYARNPRKNAGAVAKVAASLVEFGWRQPIVVDTEGVIIVGHTRLLAAQQLGMSEVPVHVAEGLTPAQAKAYRLADNRTGEEAEWDADLLPLELNDLELDGFDLSLTGFNPDEIATSLGRTDVAGVEPIDSRYKEQYGVIVVCASEADQERAYDNLAAMGYNCRVVVT
jgi:ParB-like chromosome segregation protein Spo0J